MKTRDPIMLEVAAAIGAGRISIASIENESGTDWICGYTDRDDRNAIVINPMIDVVDTVIHECLHRMRPKWGEARVRRKTAELMADLSHKELEQVYVLLMTSATIKRRRKTA